MAAPNATQPELVLRSVIERLASFGGPIFWDVLDGQTESWIGGEVWLTWEDADDFSKSWEVDLWLEANGVTRDALMYRAQVGYPTAYLHSPLDPETRKIGEVMLYGSVKCAACEAVDIEDQVRETNDGNFCRNCDDREEG